MIAVNAELAAVALAPMPFVVWAAFVYGRRNRPASQEVQQRIAELTAEAEENVSGVRVVKAFAQEQRQLKRFDRSVKRVFDQSMVSTRLRAFYSPLIGFLPQLGLAAILFVGGHQAINGSITVGDFVAFYGYVLMLTGPMRMLGWTLGMAQRAMASGARVFEVLDREPQLTAPAGAPGLPDGGGRVEFRGVTFAYDGAEPVLRDVDLDVEAGRTVALVGATGSGKTTPGRADPAALRRRARARCWSTAPTCASVDLPSLRREVALVSDDAFLFSATLRDNIAYARPDAERRRGARGGRRAGLAELVEELPDGYETLVGERGLTLSGGQRQRVAIARALLAKPRILILDDATSSVDATTESRIKDALREVMDGRTTFVIAHRLSTIALADEIVVLEDGRVAARGTHEELLESSELYREIAEKGLPDQVFLNRKRRGARGGGPVNALRGEPRRASCGQLLALLRPYRGRVILMLVALVLATGARARAALPGRPRDRRRHPRRRHGRADGDPDRVRGRRAGQLGRHLRCRPTWSTGSASARCRTCALRALRAPPAAVDRLLLAQQGGRADLAASPTTCRRSTSSSPTASSRCSRRR